MECPCSWGGRKAKECVEKETMYKESRECKNIQEGYETQWEEGGSTRTTYSYIVAESSREQRPEEKHCALSSVLFSSIVPVLPHLVLGASVVQTV